MKLTIGMATYDDFDGVYFTVQSLRMHHDLSDTEIIVVDNKPDCPAGRDLRNVLNGLPNCRYIPMPTPTGTSPPRNRVFSEAQGEAVLCLDGHVLLPAGAIAQLKQWYARHPGTQDLYHGPIIFDQLTNGATHFDFHWRGEMWGIWGQAWQCKCKELTFGVLQDDAPSCRYVKVEAGSPPVDACPRCGPLPTLPFHGHERQLSAYGYRQLGLDPQDAPFQIPGQGLGLFTCRRDAWLGFNEHFRGFGGEELYIHEKYRQAGRKVWCLPFLRWNHRFGRPAGVKFPLHRWHKVRNYVLGARELNLDLAPIEEHFVDSGLLPRDQWEAIVADPLNETMPQGGSQPATRPMPPTNTIPAKDAARGLLQWAVTVPRDIEQHLPKLAELAGQCEHVTEFSGRRESTIGLLAGIGYGKLVSYQTESDALLDQMKARYKNLDLRPLDSPAVDEIEETDLLFLDTSPHNFERVHGELEKFGPSVRRYIVLHDTESFGSRGENGGDGLWAAMNAWMREHPEWFIASHTPQQYGLTVLSKVETDKPAKPIWLGVGPGSELKKLLKDLGIEENPKCDCNTKARQMDAWGIDGCREHFDEIVQWMRDGQTRWGWVEKLAAAAAAVKTGIAKKLNWLDPYPGLIELAIERAG